jgi:hypothetical protein
MKQIETKYTVQESLAQKVPLVDIKFEENPLIKTMPTPI